MILTFATHFISMFQAKVNALSKITDLPIVKFFLRVYCWYLPIKTKKRLQHRFFTWTLRNYLEHLFLRPSANGCLSTFFSTISRWVFPVAYQVHYQIYMTKHFYKNNFYWEIMTFDIVVNTSLLSITLFWDVLFVSITNLGVQIL